MRTLLMADIHGNFAALRAIISARKAAKSSKPCVHSARRCSWAITRSGCCIRMILPATTGRCCV